MHSKVEYGASALPTSQATSAGQGHRGRLSIGAEGTVPETHGTVHASWRRGGAKVGPWCAMPSTLSVEALARAALDWLIFDLQHGLISLADVPALMPAGACGGAPVIIHVPWNEPPAIIVFNERRRLESVRYLCTSRAHHLSRGSLRGRDPRRQPRISAAATQVPGICRRWWCSAAPTITQSQRRPIRVGVCPRAHVRPRHQATRRVL